MAIDEKDTTASSGGVIISDNTKGNPYHEKGSGEFTSKEGAGGAASSSTEKKSKLSSLFKPTPTPEILSKGGSKLGGIFGRQSSDSMNAIDKKYEQEKKFNDNSQGIITLKNYLSNRDSRKKEIEKRRITLRPEQLKAIQDKQKQIFKESNMCRVMPLDDIDSFLKNGELLNLFSHLGHGSHSKDYRAMASKYMFGAEVNPTEAYTKDPEKLKSFRNLEKYGYLGNKKLKDVMNANVASGYGGGDVSGILIFDKDKMAHRTTYTIGDSLGEGSDNNLLPQLFTRAYDSCCNTNTYYKPEIDEINKCTNAQELKKALGERSYIELQYHGKVTPQDVKGICIKRSTLSTFGARLVMDKARAAGIEIYTYNKSKDTAERLVFDKNGDYTFQEINEED